MPLDGRLRICLSNTIRDNRVRGARLRCRATAHPRDLLEDCCGNKIDGWGVTSGQVLEVWGGHFFNRLIPRAMREKGIAFQPGVLEGPREISGPKTIPCDCKVRFEILGRGTGDLGFYPAYMMSGSAGTEESGLVVGETTRSLQSRGWEMVVCGR